MGLFSKKENKKAPSMQEAKREQAKKQEIQNKTATSAEERNANSAYNKYKNIDWSRVSREKTFEVMADVMNENKRLVQENNRLYSEIEYSYKNTRASNNSDTKKILEEIAQRIAPELINEINLGHKFSEIEMQEYIINSVLTNKQKYLDKILALTENQKLQKEMLTELQNQVTEVIEKRNKELAEAEEIKPFTEEDFKKITESATDKLDGDETRKSEFILKTIPLEKARIVFNEKDSLAVIKAVGIKGMSEFPEISRYVKEVDGVSENRLETVVNNLEKEDIVEVERITTFQRNTGLRLIKLKDEIGYKLFKETFKREPVKSEMQIIRAENDNYEHGYNIKETCDVLRKNYGYEDVSMDRKTNTITVSNQNTWIPDIIAINPISKKKEYFEVEMGTHNTANFNFKLDKALLVTNELKIIAPNKIKADEILGKVRAWYNSKKNNPSIVVKVYTFVEFKRKEESRIFPPILEEKDILSDVVQIQKDKKNDMLKKDKKQENIKPTEIKEETAQNSNTIEDET